MAWWSWPTFTPTSLDETSLLSPVIWFNNAQLFLFCYNISGIVTNSSPQISTQFAHMVSYLLKRQEIDPTKVSVDTVLPISLKIASKKLLVATRAVSLTLVSVAPVQLSRNQPSLKLYTPPVLVRLKTHKRSHTSYSNKSLQS